MKIVNEDLTYIEGFWNGRKTLIYKNQVCLYKEDKTYQYINGSEEYLIKLNGSLLFGLEANVINVKDNNYNQHYILASKIKWYEYLLTLSFISFVFYHYMLGAIIGGLGAVINMIVIRQYKNIFLKILFTLIIALIVFGLIFIGISILNIIKNNV